MLHREAQLSVEERPWPEGGATLLVGGERVAEVFSPDGWAGLKVTTYDHAGKPDLILRHPVKVSAQDAVSLCFVLGRPAEDDPTPYYDVPRLRKRHGKNAALILEGRGGLVCVHPDPDRMEELGVPGDVFPEQRLGEVLALFTAANLKAVLCEPEGGGA